MKVDGKCKKKRVQSIVQVYMWSNVYVCAYLLSCNCPCYKAYIYILYTINTITNVSTITNIIIIIITTNNIALTLNQWGAGTILTVGSHHIGNTCLPS